MRQPDKIVPAGKVRRSGILSRWAKCKFRCVTDRNAIGSWDLDEFGNPTWQITGASRAPADSRLRGCTTVFVIARRAV